MRIEQNKLLRELHDLTNKALKSVAKFKEHSFQELNYKVSEKKWSVLECLEHLVRYGKFYLPEIENRIHLAPKTKDHLTFKSGRLGDYFVKIIKADNGKKMTATKEMDSTGSQLELSTLDKFEQQLQHLIELIKMAEKVRLTKVKTSISLTKLVKLRMGDTLRFLVYHNQRHLIQAKRALENALKENSFNQLS